MNNKQQHTYVFNTYSVKLFSDTLMVRANTSLNSIILFPHTLGGDYPAWITPMRVPREPGLTHPPKKNKTKTTQEHRDTKSGLWVSKGSLERDAKSSRRDHRDNSDTRKQEHTTRREHGEPTMQNIQWNTTLFHLFDLCPGTCFGAPKCSQEGPKRTPDRPKATQKRVEKQAFKITKLCQKLPQTWGQKGGIWLVPAASFQSKIVNAVGALPSKVA